MLRYFCKRLLLTLPTLVGITLVTFLLIHLAPGEPVAPGTGNAPRPGITKEVIELMRRQYFLDLPLFFNCAARDRRYFVVEQIAKLGTDEAAAEGLRRMGTRAVPYLWPARARPEVFSVLQGICDDHRRICPNEDLSALAAAAAHPAADCDWGTAAAPRLMDAIEDGPESARMVAVAKLACIEHNETKYSVDTPSAERESALDYWREWWFVYQREYREFSRAERVVGLLTETQYAKWLQRIATGSLGNSLTDDRRPVADKIAERFPVTALLGLLALVISYLIAIPVGVWSAVRHQSRFDQVASVVVFVLYSLPSFWVASMLILLLGGVGFWDVFPIHGLCPRGAAERPWPEMIRLCSPHLVLPVLCMTYASLAVISRYQRTGMLDVIRQDYIRTARAKGLAERVVVVKHALKNSLIPVVTHLGLQIPALLGGSIIVEKVFGIPGMGGLAFESFLYRDYPTVMGTTVLAALLTMGTVLFCDLLCAWLDPRISYEGR